MLEKKILHILLVEDDEVDVMNVRRSFDKNKITNPLYVAFNGIQALEMLRTGEVPKNRRLVLLDLDMFGYSDPAYDAGHFLAQLERRCLLDLTVRAHARERLTEGGIEGALADRVLELVPIATHNQRGRGRLLVGAASVRAEDLVEIVEGSMSAENYDLLKRPDELFVVEKAHRRPRFVEDAVRDMLGNLVALYPSLSDDAYAHARQVNLETIHKHDVFAERGGTRGEIRAELAGGSASRATTRAEWIASRLGA